jgi:NAD(P)-dependent dehydrogenase (short-subunit alcohol dehydrogenase family)
MELDGKVVLVTGGANGIGRALCERFAREGAAGVAVVDLDGDRAQAVAAGIGERAIGLRADVSDDADVRAAVEATEDRVGPIDLLVCNAGIGSMAGVDADDDIWQRVWDVNVMAHVRAVRAVLPGMLERGGGYVLTTASAAGLLTNLGDAPYSVTKHAAVALAEWLAITHGDDGLRVSCLCPQGVDTDLLRSATGGTSGDVVVAQGVISPEAVADAVVEGLRDERFLILPHPEVAGYVQRKAADHDRWIAGMRKLQRGLRAT